jgi:hypothetical protein
MDIALQATLTINGLFEGLITSAAPLSHMPESLEEAAVVQAIAIRGRRVLSVAMSMLGDDLASLDDARRILSGGADTARGADHGA